MTARFDWLYLKVYSGDGDDVGAPAPADSSRATKD